MTHHRVAPARCIGCGAVTDSLTGAERSHRAKPAPGDIAICFQCGKVAVVDNVRGDLREMNELEFAALSQKELRDINRAVRAIKGRAKGAARAG